MGAPVFELCFHQRRHLLLKKIPLAHDALAVVTDIGGEIIC